MPLLRVFLTGLGISFLGALPLGTLNIAAMQIGVTDGVRPAILFSCGALLVEICYVRLSLVAMEWVRKHKKLFIILEWVSVLVIAALAVTTFMAAAHPAGEGKNVILSNTMHRFWLGVAMSAINPVQIPFWFGWSTVLFGKGILLPRIAYYNFYITGIGLGTFIGNAIFIFGGRLIVDKLNTHQAVLNWIIGSVFALTALIMAWKLIQRKDASEKL